MLPRLLERLISQSPWLMAPFYIGLILSLFVLLFAFVREFFHFLLQATRADEGDRSSYRLRVDR